MGERSPVRGPPIAARGDRGGVGHGCQAAPASPGDARGQVSMPLVEAAIGVILVLAVASAFALGPPGTDRRAAALDRSAGDVATALLVADPGEGGVVRIGTALRSPERFAAERAAIERRLDALVPPTLLYRVETPHGTIGDPVPASVRVGRARVTTAAGPVVVEVWHV